MVRHLELPLSADDLDGLAAGDQVTLSGIILTARDRAHNYIYNRLIAQKPEEGDRELYDRLTELLDGGCIYHCGPVMKQTAAESWEMVAGGPTTSIREEPYEGALIREFGLRCILGKGGMGADTRTALQQHTALYLHAIGGAAVTAARAVRTVVDVLKPEFGMPEAMWVLDVEDFPAIITMDHVGHSIHAEIEAASQAALQRYFDLQ